MGKGRLEAFSDGVFAIILTITVLEIKVPHGADFTALASTLPTLLSYALSFVFVGIYWNNHHHMLHATPRINGRIMWANLHLLFWLSFVPVATEWLGENEFAAVPAAVYGVLLFMSGTAYTILQLAILAFNGRDSLLGTAVGSDIKGKASQLLYLAAIVLAFVHPWISEAIYVLVAVMWFIPDPRIETKIQSGS
jgi:uncharacterized membrane protein